MRKTAIFLLVLFAALPAMSQQFLIPAAGSVPGANGTYFRSDIAMLNTHHASQDVLLQWLPQGSSGASVAPVHVKLDFLVPFGSEDFVVSVLHQTGLGAILVSAVDSQGNPVTNAGLQIRSRVWTMQPGTSGTTSQSLPVVQTTAIDNDGESSTILGQRLDARYRTNVGVVNLDPAKAVEFDVSQANDPNQPPIVVTVTVPPLSMQQVAIPAVQGSTLQIAVSPRTSADPHLWLAYGSSIDNVTGDSWSTLGEVLR